MSTNQGYVEVTAAPEDLLTLALSRPHDAISGARRLLANGPPQFTASIAHQARGIGLCQLGASTPRSGRCS
ncbi:hypothetical protein [Kribbella sp. VKM Ac-2500]|uniref:hypothetical protein n=1 Tax=Kribbella sp. VKM Ac-2500 TaxID=2512214 RepID=UPI001A7E45FA|nr:hypothetical protein [Kribbella sp. VKM Ac-2500]